MKLTVLVDSNGYITHYYDGEAALSFLLKIKTFFQYKKP